MCAGVSFISRSLVALEMAVAIVRIKGLNLFSCVDMFGSQSDSIPHSAATRRNSKAITAGILTLSGIALVCLVSYFSQNRSKETGVKPAAQQAQVAAAELVSATGMVLVRKPGRIEWQEVKTGARLMEGDLIQTDNSGDATIRYSNGTTVTIQAKTIFTVQEAGNGQMEITAPPLEAASDDGTSESSDGLSGAMLSQETIGKSRPFIELQRIIPFGRSLELIGRVEAGSSLVVNDEAVEVAGDGSFKHFTNPFPASAGKVNLVMKMTDLSGRTRILTTTHDFSPHSRGN